MRQDKEHLSSMLESSAKLFAQLIRIVQLASFAGVYTTTTVEASPNECMRILRKFSPMWSLGGNGANFLWRTVQLAMQQARRDLHYSEYRNERKYLLVGSPSALPLLTLLAIMSLGSNGHR